MTVITCDLCQERLLQSLKIEVQDGECMQNHNPLTRTIDCCAACALHIPKLTTPSQFEELKRQSAIRNS